MSEVNYIPVGWEETTLEAVAEIKYGKDHKHLNDGNIPCLGSGGFMRNVDQILYDKPSVLIPRKGTISNLFFIEQPFWTVDTLFYTKIDENKIIPKYLYFKLKTINLENLNVGSAVPSLTTAVLNQLTIDIPKNINEQESIASILTSFDNKIDLLEAQNKTLEETAQTIFAEWFNKYKNGDELPEGWQIDSLEKIANHSKTSIKPFDNPDTDYYHYSLPSYDNGLIPVIEKGEMIKSNKYLVENNSFLVSKLNPFTPRIWTIFDSQQNFICSTEFQVVKPKEELYFSLIHCFLNSDEFTSELSQKIKGTSSSHQRVNPQDIFDVELVIPSENDLIKFNSVIYPLLAKKNINHKQIQTLSQTRDELLPRLMTGEIRVNDFKV
jgi:type I restriction enzyme S subunit